MNKTKLYVSGGITGIDNFRSIFAENDKKLTEAGYEVLNPLNIPACIDRTCDGILTSAGYYKHSWVCNMRHDIAAMVFCDGIAMIEGWEFSAGATAENAIFKSLALPAKSVAQWVYEAGE